MIEAKRVPYGVSDFLRIIRENQYYVDKTMYIPLLVKGSFAKIFMMGVSPVTLDDVTSGFNIGWHI